ncbi:hypothetical protein MPTK1_7g10950 [Marchantia polymorpha subsp. ruderalis]|uniref:Uncharacterized protein n=1 Tax=Marchantia polymorpha subsp. ruderalis TaxID=1480154 RepID=A0AAF6BY96_MARPO|nr:hypothetical protein Mp_7g10950 [Marchantia polymorpha subsp. ruderalis]
MHTRTPKPVEMNRLSTLWFIVALLVQLCATSVVGIRPSCQELPPKLKGAETYELRPKDGYFTLVDHGCTSAELGEHSNENLKGVHPMDSERAKGVGLPHVVTGSNSKDTLQAQQLQWPEAETKRQEQGGGDSRRVPKPAKFGGEASKDVVVTVEEKALPVEQEKERAKERVVILDAGERKKRGDADDDSVPEYVLVRAPKMDRVSKSQDQMVTISLETLNGLIKGSLFPPSGPNMAHNWYMADLPERSIYKDPVAVADQMLLVRVVPADKSMLDNAAAADLDALPGFQELPDGTFRIKD